MATGGQNIKSVKDHKEKGNYRPSRHANRAEGKVKLMRTPPKPPAYLDKKHSELWSKVCRQAFELGVLAESDLHLIETFVVNWFIWIDACATIRKEGFIDLAANGSKVKHPAVNVMNDAQKVINAIADRFGFNPKARMGIKVDPQEDEDTGSQFLNN